MTAARFSIAFAVLAVGCGDGGDEGEADGGGPACWPEAVEERGTIELGTGQAEFVAMPDEQPLVWGIQGGYHVEVNARMTGLDPGDSTDSIEAGNPRTRFSATFVDSGATVTETACPIWSGYRETAAADGSYELPYGAVAIFDTAYQAPELFGRELKLVVEIIDRDGGYARDERVVTALEPVGGAPR